MKKYIESISSKYIQIYKGKYNTNIINGLPHARKINKVVVLDLDETIGSFGELIVLWDCLEKIKEMFHLPFECSQELFNAFIDLYPECLRYGILVIFEYLLHKKKTNECHKIFVYTNNKYSPDFPNKIQKYIDYKLKTDMFIDKIIYAFKINNVIIEPMRTDHKKTYTDFIRCSVISKNTEICFIDNTYYSKMKHDKIYYIQPKSYNHKLMHSEIIDRFSTSSFFLEKILQNNITHQSEIMNYITTCYKGVFLNEYNAKITIETPLDLVISQKIMYHMKEFFYLTTRHIKTKKIKYIFGKFTRKKHTRQTSG